MHNKVFLEITTMVDRQESLNNKKRLNSGKIAFYCFFMKNVIDHIVERPYNKSTLKPDSNEFQTWGGILCKFKRYGKKGISIKKSFY